MKILIKNCRLWDANGIQGNEIAIDTDTGKIVTAADASPDKVIDGKGKLVMPAFNDSHCHLIKGAHINNELNLRSAVSKNDFRNSIEEYLKTSKEDWVFGGYFSDAKLDFEVTKDFLDEVCPHKPLLIFRFDFHSGFANSLALKISETSKEDFSEQEAVRDTKDELTGEVKESALYFMKSKVPVKSVLQQADILKIEIEKLHSIGIVSVTDITLPEDLDVYEHILLKDKLNLDIYSVLPFKEFYFIDAVKSRFENYNNLRFNCFKAFYDGSLSSETAYFHNNYKNRSHNGFKTEFAASGELHRIAENINSAGYQCAVHAIGDKSVTELLDLAGKLQKIRIDNRFRIEHSQHIIEQDLVRFKKLNVIASIQPGHLFSDAKTSVSKLNDYSTTHCYKKLIDLEANYCMGTDFPIISESPIENIYYAVTRTTDTGEEFIPELKLSIDEALAGYTFGSAYASFSEKTKGLLSPGYDADIIIMDNIRECSTNDILNCKVHSTFYKGNKVH